MGFFDFLKKKGSDQPIQESLDYPDINSDIPPISGSNMPDAAYDEGNSNIGSLPELPSLLEIPNPMQDFKPDTARAPPQENLWPNETFQSLPSLPSIDDTQSGNIQPPLDINQFNIQQFSGQVPKGVAASDMPLLSAEELNKLFIPDGWKEPDLDNYDPYSPERIDAPQPRDFGAGVQRSDLPGFEEDASHDIRRAGSRPLEVYIKGQAYARVFTELSGMNKTLKHQEAQIMHYEDASKSEEALLQSAKEDAEYLYRKLSQIDKKIFA